MADRVQLLKDFLGTGTTAYAVVCDGVLDAGSISPDPRASMMWSLFQMEKAFLPCGKDDCDCLDRFFKMALPTCKLVMVSVTVIEEGRE